MCLILSLLALGSLFGSPDFIEANYRHFLAQISSAGRMKAIEERGPEVFSAIVQGRSWNGSVPAEHWTESGFCLCQV